MNNLKYTTLATDVDGTILNEKGRLSKASLETLKKLNSSGIKIILCTGRSHEGALGLMGPYGFDWPVVSVNGGLVRHGPTVLNQILLDRELAVHYARLAAKMGLYIHAYVGTQVVLEKIEKCALYYVGWNQTLTPEYRLNLHTVHCLSDYLSATQDPIYKLLLMDSDSAPGSLALFRKQAEADTNIACSSSSERNCEIQPKGCSKGAALSWYAAQSGLDLSRTVAIGDGENDVELFQVCGFSIAMGNASQHVKNKAARVALSNSQDGFSQIIKQVFFNV
jgi:Cof subfamily protein (haloacid dehalogenase superfamily)